MADIKQQDHVARLRLQIEATLNWGESNSWNNYDFEKLTEHVSEKTGVALSVSTLKRIFGKVNYQNTPSLTTLNTLACFIDYADWRAFITAAMADNTNIEKDKAKNTAGETAADKKQLVTREATPAVTDKKRKTFFLQLVLPVLVIVAVAAAVFAFYSAHTKPAYDPNDFSFSSKAMLGEGVPNSVVFDYDASKAKEDDSVFIAQSWDVRRKVSVSKNDKHYSSVYYYPGYFKAKLMIGNEIIREQDIQIQTDEWLGLIEADPGKVPLYFRKEEITHENKIAIDEALLNKYKISLMPDAPKTCLFNCGDFGDVSTNHFTFETEIKSNVLSNACRKVQVLLQAKDDMMMVPLASKGCIGDISLYAYGFQTSSKTDDLSGFGTALDQWTTLRIACKDDTLTFFVNGKKVYTAPLHIKPSQIVGVEYRFEGCGAVRNAWIEGKKGKVILQ